MSDQQVPERPDIKGYEVLEVLGRGGMGVVYKARQRSLGRIVALKMLLAGAHAGPRELARFRAEAEALARLGHPHIVPIYEVGEQDGLPFFSMEYVDGGSLADQVGQPIPVLAAAQLIETLARSMHAAHERGIVHRDLKPANVLLQKIGVRSEELGAKREEAGGMTKAHSAPDSALLAPGSFIPKIADFGLAKKLDDAVAGPTVSGTILGTPSYMAPEQAGAGGKRVGPAADVYALGAILYELLTGRPPFKATTGLDTLLQVVTAEPTPPTQLRPRTPRDLETIALKCLAKAPEGRYATALALAEDLRSFQENRVIAARPAGVVERLGKWSRRHPTLAVSIVAALMVCLLAGYFGYEVRRAEELRQADALQRTEQAAMDRQREILEKGLQAAILGDLPTADVAIAEAEALGTSGGDLAMLKGQVAYLRGHYVVAIDYLQRAIKLKPTSVAPLAMLALVYFDFGDWEGEHECLLTMNKLTPVTYEDFLFKGYAEAIGDSVQGLKTLDEAAKKRPSVIANVMRAHMRTRRAMETGQAEFAEEAIKGIDGARQLLADNPNILRKSLYARLAAAVAYEQSGPTFSERRQAVLKEAGDDARALGPYIAQPNMGWALWQYNRYIGQEDAMLGPLKGATATSSDPTCAYAYGMILYHRGDLKGALAALQSRKGNAETDMAMLFVLAELPDGPRRAREAFDAMTYKDATILTVSQNVLRLLGRKAEAAARCRDYRSRPDLFPESQTPVFNALLDYGAGALAEADLLKVAAGTRRTQCYAHFTIGLTRLADGDRAGARQSLRQALATKFFYLFVYDVSRVLLERLERDADWPPWIPHY